MKILLVSTYEKQGGAGIACFRLYQALKHSKAEVRLLVMHKTSNEQDTSGFNTNAWQRFRNFFNFAFERFYFLFFERSAKVRFAFSIANTGRDISKHPWVRESDIINLHWVNQGFLSVDSIEKLAQTGKPVVWTLHDMWPFTGGCHYSGTCKHYMQQCGNCPFLRNPSDHDLSNHVWLRKNSAYSSLKLTVITPSKWLAECATKSSLFANVPVHVIPNPFNLQDFKPQDRLAARKQLNLPADKKLVLFAAAKVDDERKGYQYLIKALELLRGEKNWQDLEIVVMGFVKHPEQVSFPVKAHFTGKLSGLQAISSCYSAADLFIAPSLEDNLPNTIIEAFACGTPVVAFNSGGIPEIIDHKENGYVAEHGNANDLAEGIKWVLGFDNSDELRARARLKAQKCYDQEVIAPKYLEAFRKAAARS